MNNRNFHLWLRNRQHVPDDELLALLDGELKPRQTEKIRMHLDACWQCRTRQDRMRQTIAEFISTRQQNLSAPGNQPPGGWRLFNPRLRRLELDLEGQPAQWPNPVRFRPTWRFAGIGVVAAAALLWLEFSSVRVVSAKQLLELAGRAEAARVHQTKDSVVHQKLRVTRRTGAGPATTAEVELWNDAGADRMETRGGEIVWEELRAAFAGGLWRTQAPLSPAGLEAWWKSIQEESASVRPVKLADGKQGYWLQVVSNGPHARSSIIEMRLLVRAADWWPVEQVLKVQGDREVREYRLVLSGYRIVPRLTVASLFAPPPPTPKLTPQALVVSVPRKALLPRGESDRRESDEDMLAAEVNTLYALHRAGACVGEPLEIIVSAAGVRVHGVVETVERKRQLALALRDIRGVRVEILTIGEAMEAEPVAPEASEASAMGGTIEIRGAALPIEEQLRDYFSSYEASGNAATHTIKLANGVVSEAGASLSHAWALHRLLKAFPSEKALRLHPPPIWLLESMLRDHVNGIRQSTGRYRALVEPVLSAVFGQLAEPANTARETSGRAALLSMFERVQDIDRLTRRLFAGAPTPDEPPEHTVSALLTALTELSGESRDLESRISIEMFSESRYPDSP
ncbi:MAG: hypothetical protein WD696_10385 [Bryobacteraceae bacterium]